MTDDRQTNMVDSRKTNMVEVSGMVLLRRMNGGARKKSVYLKNMQSDRSNTSGKAKIVNRQGSYEVQIEYQRTGTRQSENKQNKVRIQRNSTENQDGQYVLRIYFTKSLSVGSLFKRAP